MAYLHIKLAKLWNVQGNENHNRNKKNAAYESEAAEDNFKKNVKVLYARTSLIM